MMHMHAVIMAVLDLRIYLLVVPLAPGPWAGGCLGGRLSLWDDITGNNQPTGGGGWWWHMTSSAALNDIIGAVSMDHLALVPEWKVRKKQVSPRQDREMVAPCSGLFLTEVHLYTFRCERI